MQWVGVELRNAVNADFVVLRQNTVDLRPDLSTKSSDEFAITLTLRPKGKVVEQRYFIAFNHSATTAY